MKRTVSAIVLVALLGMAACGEDSPSYEPLSAKERAAVGTYRIGLVCDVTEKQRRDLLSMEWILGADRTLNETRWLEKPRGRYTMTGTWRIKAGKLVTTVTGYHAVDVHGLPRMELPEPLATEYSYEEGAIRPWSDSPFLLRRVE